ncbi:MAG: hypothetical protein ACRECP_07805 [Methylocella sp.]
MTSGPQGQRRSPDAIGCAVVVARIATGEVTEKLKPSSGKDRSGKADSKARAPLMTMIHRRHFLRRATLLLAVAAPALSTPANVALAQQQTPGKAILKRSEARTVVTQYVEKMAQDAKERMGVDLSSEQKNKMVSDILWDMETTGIYTLVDP